MYSMYYLRKANTEMQEPQSPHFCLLSYFTTTWLVYSFSISTCSLLLKIHILLKKIIKFLLSQSYVQEIVKLKLVKMIFKINKLKYF